MAGSITGFLNAVGEYDYTYFGVGNTDTRINTGGRTDIPPVKERIRSYLDQAQIDCFIE